MVKNGSPNAKLANVIKRYGKASHRAKQYEGKTAAGKVVSRGVNIFSFTSTASVVVRLHGLDEERHRPTHPARG